MNEEILKEMLSNREILKLKRWNEDWIGAYTIKNHSFHAKDSSLSNLLADFLKWRELEL